MGSLSNANMRLRSSCSALNRRPGSSLLHVDGEILYAMSSHRRSLRCCSCWVILIPLLLLHAKLIHGFSVN